MTPKSKYKIVEVSWVDSEHEASWNNISDVIKTSSMECRSCGYLIVDKEDRIILATSISTESEDLEEQVSAYLQIPKVSILWLKELRRK